MISVAAAAALAQTSAAQTSPTTPSDSKPAQPLPHKPDRGAAYYHYAVAHMYEEQVTVYGRSDLANKAIEEYRLAIDADPSSEFLTSGLAELYVKTGRIRDAVLEAQDIIKRDPKNLEAHKLLGRIYLRSLGDMPGGNGSDNVLKLAIEQYEQIVKIEPENVDDHLLLGRLYRLNTDLQKAEAELKTAVKLDPSSEEAVTTLAMLYTDEGDTAHALQVLSSVPDSARSAKLYAALGAAYEQRKDYKSAVDSYRHAIVLDRDNLDAIRGLAENLMNDGQAEAALEQYKVIADANPEDAQTYVRIAEIYRRQAKYEALGRGGLGAVDRQAFLGAVLLGLGARVIGLRRFHVLARGGAMPEEVAHAGQVLPGVAEVTRGFARVGLRLREVRGLNLGQRHAVGDGLIHVHKELADNACERREHPHRRVLVPN